jgi:hypothetical protein
MLKKPDWYGHNLGPPLDMPHPWGEGPIASYFEWRAAHDAAFRAVPHDVAMRRARKAQACGLTYAEYTIELLERGRYLQPTDTARIAEIKLRRPLRY